MLPVIGRALEKTVVGIVTFVIGAVITALVARNWDLLVGKRVCVFGRNAVGKTTLVEFLKIATVPDDYEETLSTNPVKGKGFWKGRRKLKNGCMTFTDIEDPPGRADSRTAWKNILMSEKPHVVLYLFCANRVRKKCVHPKCKSITTEADQRRVIEDLGLIRKWCNDLDSQPIFILVGTHSDLDQDSPKDAYSQAVSHSVIRRMLNVFVNGNTDQFLVGSLRDIETTENLAEVLFKKLISLMKQQKKTKKG